MFVEITNEPRDYAWGSTTLIPGLLGVAPDGRPQAELWFGTHAGSPSRLVGREGDLRDVAGELPFLLKILAAGSPLSLQAHPTTAQAEAGFARENAAGIPIDAPHRNYKDPYAKPEMVYALSDEFRALCGFRPVAETRAALDAVAPGLLPDLRTDADLREVVERLLTTDVAAEVGQITAVARDAVGASWATVRLLAGHYPGDPGVAISLLLHTVVLRHGEALYLPAGHLHAYLDGLGVELMGPSDNVLRAGLTAKHVDVRELLAIVDFTPVADPRLAPAPPPGAGVARFAPPAAGFVLDVCDSPGVLESGSSAIVVVLAGSATVRETVLGAGRAGYLEGERVSIGPASLVVIARVC